MHRNHKNGKTIKLAPRQSLVLCRHIQSSGCISLSATRGGTRFTLYPHRDQLSRTTYQLLASPIHLECINCRPHIPVALPPLTHTSSRHTNRYTNERMDGRANNSQLYIHINVYTKKATYLALWVTKYTWEKALYKT